MYSKAPLSEAFGNWQNGKIALIALFGLTAGQAVIWYGGQFYARLLLVNTLKIPANAADIALIIALAIATVGFLFFGWLSDKIGRKPIMLAGFALAVVTYFPIFQGITHFANPKLEHALATAPVSQGAGLGLALCRRLARTAGGDVHAEPSDAGARFVVRLPA